jgi:hypothetical protein
VSSSTSSSSARKAEAGAYFAWLAATAAAFFLVIWLYVALMPMAFLSRDYPLWIAKKAMIDECALGSVAVFGDSRVVAAIMPKVMPLETSNLGMSSTGPIETYFAVSHALRCADPPKLVVIAHGPGNFGGDASFWDEGPLLGFLNYAELRDVDEQAARLHDLSSRGQGEDGKLFPALRDWLYSVRFPSFYYASLVNGCVAGRWWHNMNALQSTRQSGGHALFGTEDGSSNLAGESKMRSFQVSPLEDHYFTKTLDLLRSRNITTLFVSMPVNQSTYDMVAPDLGAGLSAYLRSKENEFHNFKLVGAPISCWPDSFFGDNWHFNQKGAETYSHEFGAWLQRFAAGEHVDSFGDRCVRRTGTTSRDTRSDAAPPPQADIASVTRKALGPIVEQSPVITR